MSGSMITYYMMTSLFVALNVFDYLFILFTTAFCNSNSNYYYYYHYYYYYYILLYYIVHYYY
jgi:hypothetical protein